MAEKNDSGVSPMIVVDAEEKVTKKDSGNTADHHGILKKRGRKLKPEEKDKRMSSGIQWDEMNILMTEHPPGKDYGHMKIDEPKTPYHEMNEDDGEGGPSDMTTVQSDDIAERMLLATRDSPSDKGDLDNQADSSDDDGLSDEAKEKKQKFKQWRKAHYNEYQAVQRARQLMKEDEEELRRLEEMESADKKE